MLKHKLMLLKINPLAIWYGLFMRFIAAIIWSLWVHVYRNALATFQQADSQSDYYYFPCTSMQAWAINHVWCVAIRLPFDSSLSGGPLWQGGQGQWERGMGAYWAHLGVLGVPVWERRVQTVPNVWLRAPHPTPLHPSVGFPYPLGPNEQGDCWGTVWVLRGAGSQTGMCKAGTQTKTKKY